MELALALQHDFLSRFGMKELLCKHFVKFN